jgi:AraC-like DNA-binding protein
MSRYFKSNFNITLVKYMTIVKLKNAIMLMHENKYGTTYCSLESGFSSMRTFYRAFYNEFGCSPKEYFEAKR